MKIKKIYKVAIAVIALVPATLKVQAQAFDKTNEMTGLGFGIGGYYNSYDSYSSQSPAIGIMYEKAMQWEAGPGVIGMGGYLGYKTLTYKNPYPPFGTYNIKWSYVILGLRAAYHYSFIDDENLDTYGGLMLGYNVITTKDNSTFDNAFFYNRISTPSHFSLTPFIGARYYFSQQWGGFAELGYGVAVLQLGVAYKF